MNLAYCFSSLHLVLIKCCESKFMFCNLFLLRKTAPLIPFILFEQHFMYCISICILRDCNFLKGNSYFV